MNPYNFWIALFALAGFAVVAPAWMHFIGTLDSLPIETRFLASFVLPMLALLFGVSWLNPGG